jgi:hypothetical protein
MRINNYGNPNLIFCICVKDARVKEAVDRLVTSHNVNCYVDINSAMFVGE